MAYVNDIQTTSSFGIIAFFRSMMVKLAQHNAYKATLTELDALSEAELDDIGLARGDIYHVARKAAYGK